MAVSPKWNAILQQFLHHFTAHTPEAHKSQMTECRSATLTNFVCWHKIYVGP